jgi:plastocyanin
MARIRHGAALIGVAIIVAACSGGGGGTPGPAATTPGGTTAAATCSDSTAATTVETAVGDSTWSPVTAKVGDVITWTNADGIPHRVELDDGSCKMSGNIPGGGTRSLVFSVAGTFPFHCGVHPGMKSTITITG